MNRTINIFAMSKALAPITHQKGTVGNESVLNDEPVRTPYGVRRIPMLSGNALRHRMVRSPAAHHLVEAWELDGKLTKDELNLLFHGGLTRVGGMGVSLAKMVKVADLFPVFRLLGACLPEDIMGGNLTARRAILVCRENASRIRSLTPPGWCDQAVDDLAPAATFVGRWQYVRGEARKSAWQYTPSDARDIDADPKRQGSDMMPFAGTCVLPGAEFVHGFVLKDADPVSIGCLLHSIDCWQDGGGVVGGQGSRGHGILETSLHLPPEIDQRNCINAYLEHVSASQDDGVSMLKSMYAPPPKKAKQKSLVVEETE